MMQNLSQVYTKSFIQKSSDNPISEDEVFLERIIRIIEANIEEKSITPDSLASEANMSVSQLNRKLNALIGQPSGRLIRELRLQRAVHLLENKSGTIAQVCYQLGYNDQAYFSRAFKKQYGCSPGKYIKG
jgi:AraC-like DNA-binding protein